MSSTDPKSEYLRYRLERHRLETRRPEWLSEFRSVCAPDADESDFLPGDEAEALAKAFYRKLMSTVGIHATSYEAQDSLG